MIRHRVIPWSVVFTDIWWDQIRDSFLPAFLNASVAWSRSFLVCALVTIVRILALSLPTIGNTIGRTNTPSLNISSASLWAFPLSPTMTGVMGVSLCPVSKLSSFNAFLKYRVLSQSLFTSNGFFFTSWMAAIQAPGMAGGWDPDRR